MRRLRIGLYIVFGAGLCLLLLVVCYAALPEVTHWTLDEAKLPSLTQEELTNDYWQWHPSPDRELLAIGRTEYTGEKPIFPDLIRPTWGYYIYFRFRVSDNLRSQLSSAVRSGRQPISSYQRQRPDEPLPAWWHPKFSITLVEDNEVYFFDAAEPDIAYTTRHYEGTPPK